LNDNEKHIGGNVKSS